MPCTACSVCSSLHGRGHCLHRAHCSSLASPQVRPVLSKLRGTLVGAGALLLTCSLLLTGLISAHSDEDGVYGEKIISGGVYQRGGDFSGGA